MTVLYLGANPPGTEPLVPDDECRAVALVLRDARHRFELASCWATEADELIHQLRASLPVIAHLGGHTCDAGLVFPGEGGALNIVSYELINEVFQRAGSSVKLVVLTGCASDPLARLLLPLVDCTISIDGAICDQAAMVFARGLYAAIGDGATVEQAFEAACTAIQRAGLPGADRPRLRVRSGVDPTRIVLAGASRSHTSVGHRRSGLVPVRRARRLIRRGAPRRGAKPGAPLTTTGQRGKRDRG
jgi:hypothetical protein